MKYPIILLSFIFFAHEITLYARDRQNNKIEEILASVNEKPKNSKQNAQVVIGNLAHIIGQIGNIIKDPHNAQNISSSVAGITSGIVNITMNAVQNRTLTNHEAMKLRKYLQKLHDKLRQKVKKLNTPIPKQKRTLL